MKLVELKCPACNGTLRMDPDHPGEAVCDYCKSRYIVENEGGEDNYRLGEEKKQQQQQQEENWYIAAKMQSQAEQVRQNRVRKTENRVMALVGVILVVFIGFIVISRSNHGSLKPSGKTTAMAPAAIGAADETVGDAAGDTSLIAWSKGMELVIGEIYGTDADQVSPQELAKLRVLYLKPSLNEMDTNRRFFRVQYSLDGDTDAAGEPVLHTFEHDLPPDISRGWDLFDNFSCLQKLTGLEKLNVGSSLKPGDLSGLTGLKSLGIRYCTVQDAAALLDDPGQLTELDYDSSGSSLDGIGAFSGLESLNLRGSEDLTDINGLAALTGLKSLSLKSCSGLTDFSVLFALKGLEQLSLDIDGLKDISFVNSLPELKSFIVNDSSCLSFKPLETCQNLRELSLTGNRDVKDYQVVAGLTGLTGLTLHKYSTQPDPDLNGLTQMSRLDVSGFDSCSFLSHMGGLTDLTISGGGIESGRIFEGLTKLTRFKGTGSWEYVTDAGFLGKLPALTELDLAGTTFYTDISSAFNKQGIETINMNGSSFELNFSRLKDNSSLKSLSMKGVKLYKNVKIQRSGFISQIGWDDVSLDSELGFLPHYPGLETLNLADNKLTQIQPVSQLPMLGEINISKNYVTDLTPLSGLELLKQADCRDNPVSNWQVLREGVQVIK